MPQNAADVGSVTEYRAVIVSYNDRSVLEPTITEALARLFPGFDGDLGEEIEQPTEPGAGTTDPDESTDSDTPTDPDPPTDPDTGVASGDPEELLNEADALFAAADDALADGDLGLYQQNIDAARDLIADAVEILINQS